MKKYIEILENNFRVYLNLDYSCIVLYDIKGFDFLNYFFSPARRLSSF